MSIKLVKLFILVVLFAVPATAEESKKVYRSRSGGSASAAFRNVPSETPLGARARLAEKTEEITEPTETEVKKFRSRSGGSASAQVIRKTK